MKETSYRPEVDGMRALAVTAVLLFHFGLGLSGGYVGVDVFFVISGFLITGIILRAQENDSFSLAEFWERRIRRIFPALAVVVAVVFGAGLYILLPADLSDLGKSSVSQAILLANVYFWRTAGYFDGPAELKPLLHTWSLAVEEQFYLFFPLLLIALKQQRRRVVFWVIAGLAVMSLSLSIYGTRYYPVAAFYLLPTRAWELFAGCLLACIPWTPASKPRRDDAMSIVGLAFILVPMFIYDSKTQFPGLAATVPVAGTLAVLYATGASKGTLVGRLLSLRPIVFVGLISYSLYLWHWPVVAYLRYASESFGPIQIFAAALLTFSLSVLSWRFVETPFRHKRLISCRSSVFAASAVGTGSLVCVGVLFISGQGLPGRFGRDLALAIEDTSWTGSEYTISPAASIRMDELPALGTASPSDDRLDLVLWGDSHGMVLTPLIDEIATEADLSGVAILNSGIPPAPNLWLAETDRSGAVARAHNAAVMDFLATERPRNLLLIARWSVYSEGRSEVEIEANPALKKTGTLVADRRGAMVSPSSSSQAIARQLKNLASHCEAHGIRVWILKQVPETGEPNTARDYLMWLVGRRSVPPSRRLSIADHSQRQRLSDDAFRGISSEMVHLIDPAAFCFDAEGMTVNFTNGRACYRDDDHLTRWGAEALRVLMTQIVLEMKEPHGKIDGTEEYWTLTAGKASGGE